MKYLIEVDKELSDILTSNANKRNMNVTALIAEILKRYVIDSHIMEQSELWERGAADCAELELDWANL